MARVALLNDSQPIAEAIANTLSQEGHQVVVAVAVLEIERMVGFVPQIIVVTLTSSPAPQPDSAKAAPAGYESLIALEDHPALTSVPRIVLGSGIQECDVPTKVAYDGFLEFPVDIERLSAKVTELVGKTRTRHKLSEYFCPQCHARLVCVYGPHDLFCLRCGTAVTIEGDECDALTVSGHRIPCSLEHLRLPTRQGPN